MTVGKQSLQIFLLFLFFNSLVNAQFIDHFDKDEIKGWFYFTGDGNVEMDFVQKDGYARILLDATNDKHNVWWAITKRDVSDYLDLSKLKDPSYELRVEAKVRVSHAPRRVNFMINTQRTTNFHEHLMEYDIPDTAGWHVISMTTKNLDAVPGDTLYVQFDVTDWGTGKYYVDVDYYRADIVDVNLIEPDKGEPLPYHPPVPGLETFATHLDVMHDGIINVNFPDVNFDDWYTKDTKGKQKILTVDASKWIILRWDFDQYKNLKAEGSGLLELTTYSLQNGGDYVEVYGEDFGMEFGKIRVIEIIGGDPGWEQDNVTYSSFMQGNDLYDVINSQMIFDAEVSEEQGSKNYITISRPVMQRLLSGKTKGLIIRPLGALNVSFYDSENKTENVSPKIHFNITE